MDYKDIKIKETYLRVYKNGDIHRIINDKIKKCKLGINKLGYRQINIENQTYTAHRIVGYTFLELDLDNSKQCIDHINRDRTDNTLENLRIVTYEQNNWNRGYIKGVTKVNKRYRATISIKNKIQHIGYYKTEEEAHQAYLEAKEKNHKITNILQYNQDQDSSLL